MRLWVRLAAIIAMVSIGLVFVTSYGAMDVATKKATARSTAFMELEAQLRADVLSQWMGEQAAFLRGWSEAWPRVAEMSPEGQRGFLRAVYRARPSLVIVVLVDRSGAAVVDPVYLETPTDRPAGSPERVTRLLERLPSDGLARGASSAVGTPYLVTAGAELVFPVAVDVGGELVLGAEVVLEAARDLQAQSDPVHGLALMTARGEAVIGGDHPLVDPSLLLPLLQSRADFRYDKDGQTVRGFVVPVDGTNQTLSVVVVEPLEVNLASAREIRENTVPFVLGAVAVALVLGLLFGRGVSRPVADLRDAALAVADGRVGVRAEIARSDEIGELAQAFNHMSTRLESNRSEIEAQQAEIEAFNVELQDRVEERTRQLEEAQEQLVQSGQLAAVAQVGAGLAHELNNPLAAILGIAQLLRARAAEGPNAAMLESLEEQAARCREVVATMLRFASGDLDPSAAPVVDLRDALGEVNSLVRGPFRQRGVALDIAEAGPPLRVRIDPVQCTRILAQVASAMRAGLDEGASVSIDAGPCGEDEVEVVLRADRPVAAARDRRDDFLAQGMELWVARRLLHDVGGRVEVPETASTTWRIVLPAA